MSCVDRSEFMAANVPALLHGVGGDVSHPITQHIIRVTQAVVREPVLTLALSLQPIDPDAPPGSLQIAVLGTMQSWAHAIACLERQAEESGNGPALRAALDQEREHIKAAKWGQR